MNSGNSSSDELPPDPSLPYWRGDVLVMPRRDGDLEFHYSDSSRLLDFYKLPQAAQLLLMARLALAGKSGQAQPLIAARAGPLICEPTPGALSGGVLLDLSDRAVELLSALAADQDPGV